MAERLGTVAGSGLGASGRLATAPLGQRLLAAMARFARWFGDSLIHALGNPDEERRLQPPLIGVQPYCDRPYRMAR